MQAAVVIRGALSAVLGQKLGGVCSPVLPILSEPGTAKITISIKGCAREAELRAGKPADHEEIFKAVEAAANVVIAADLAITTITFPDEVRCKPTRSGDSGLA